jgi:hypothetical protein
MTNPCYISPTDPSVVMLKSMAQLGTSMSVCGQIMAACPQYDPPIPLAVLRYTFGPLIVHVPRTTVEKGDLGWLDRETLRRWQPRVDLERLEILCGERPDLVSPAEIWLVMYNATFEAPLAHPLIEIYLWASHRATIAAGMDSPLTAEGNRHPVVTDEAVFDGHLNHEYRELCRAIISTVVAHSQIQRRPPRKQAAE